MTFKLGFLLIPLTISSIINVPSFDNNNHSNKQPSFSFFFFFCDSGLPSISLPIISSNFPFLIKKIIFIVQAMVRFL